MFISQRILVFATNSDFLIPISLQPNVVDLKYMVSVRSNNLSFKYQKFTPSGCKDKGIRIVRGKVSFPFFQ